jgi:hypothetical protein
LSVAVLILGQKEMDDRGQYGARSFWFEVFFDACFGGKLYRGAMSD